MSVKFGFGQEVTLQVPPYNEDDPVLWFYLLEIFFRRASIETSFDKYELTILSIASDKSFRLLHEMRDLIFEQASLPICRPYETLKFTIIKRALQPELEKLVKEVEMGKLQPSNYLQRIKDMFGHPWNNDIDLKEIFTVNLPSPLHNLVKILGQEESLETLASSLDSVFDSIIQPSKDKTQKEFPKLQPSAKGADSESISAEEKRKIKKRNRNRKLQGVYPRPLEDVAPLVNENVCLYNLKEKQVDYKSHSQYGVPSFIGSFRIS